MTPKDERPGTDGEPGHPVGSRESESVHLAAIAKSEFYNRRRRDSLIRYDVFAEPAWDLLLELYIQHHEGRPVDLGRLIEVAGVTEPTTLRWVGLLMEKDLVARLPHGGESKDPQIVLTRQGVAEMERYLRDFLLREQLGGDIAAALHRGIGPRRS